MYASTSPTLFASHDPILLDLVWDAIATNLSTIVSTWWENPGVVERLNVFRRVSSKIQMVR